ncbi:hypothetical protein L9F63_015830, partial [Diploptera punctata]
AAYKKQKINQFDSTDEACKGIKKTQLKFDISVCNSNKPQDELEKLQEPLDQNIAVEDNPLNTAGKNISVEPVNSDDNDDDLMKTMIELHKNSRKSDEKDEWEKRRKRPTNFPDSRGKYSNKYRDLQWEKRRKRPTNFPDSRGKCSKKYRDPPVGEEEKTGRRGENVPQHFPDSRGKHSNKYRDPPVGEEEKTSHKFPRLPRETLQEISGSSSGRRGENWEKRRKRPTNFPDSRGKYSKKHRDPPVGEEEKTSHNFPRLPREILEQISGSSSGRRGENVPQHFPDSRGKHSNKYRDPPVGEEEKTSHKFPRLPREIPEQISGSSMGEEEKTSHNSAPTPEGNTRTNIGIL